MTDEMKPWATAAAALGVVLLVGSVWYAVVTKPAAPPTEPSATPAASVDPSWRNLTLGPFREDAQDLQIFSSFLLRQGRELLAECGANESSTAIVNLLGKEFHLEALDVVYNACGNRAGDLSGMYAEQAMRDGTELSVKNQLKAEALAAVDAFEKKLNAHPGPSNAVEAEVLGWLGRRHHFELASIGGSEDYWKFYADGSHHDELQLRNVYLNLLSPRAESEVMGQLLDDYPWEGTPCTAPDLTALVERTRAKFDQALAMAKTNAKPGEERGLSAWYGRLLHDTIPQFEFYANHSWWVSLMLSEVRAEAHIAYWENRTSGRPMPSLEEAQAMLARARNESRTLLFEYEIRPYLGYFNDTFLQSQRPWDTNVNIGAVAFKGTMALRWAYANLECPTA